MTNAVVYLGFNSFLEHKRGVENVILCQAYSTDFFAEAYYVSFGSCYRFYEFEGLRCIAIKNNILYPILLNVILVYLKLKHTNLVIHSHNYLFSFLVMFKLNLITVHDGLYYQSNSVSIKLRRIKGFLLKAVEKFVYFKAKRIHVISSFTKNNCLLSDVAMRKVIIVPNSSQLENSVFSSLRLGLKPPPNRTAKCRNVLIVRSVEDRPNLSLVLEVAKRRLDIQFTICGKGPKLKYFVDKCQREGISNVNFKGFVEESVLMKLYHATDIVAVPALYGEGFGLPVIEGYLFDKPVIASNVCALPEVIVDVKFLFDNNVYSFEESLNYAINNAIFFDFNSYYYEKYSASVYKKNMKNLYRETFV